MSKVNRLFVNKNNELVFEIETETELLVRKVQPEEIEWLIKAYNALYEDCKAFGLHRDVVSDVK